MFLNWFPRTQNITTHSWCLGDPWCYAKITSYYACYSVFEEQEAASVSSVLPAAEDTLERTTSLNMIADDIEEFLLIPSKASKLPFYS